MNDFETVVERHPPALPGAADHAAGSAATQGGLAAGPQSCPRCGGHRDAPDLGLCWLCSHREHAAAMRAKYSEQAAGRREDYFWLRDEQRLTISQAAERVGISRRQAHRYEAMRKAGAA